MSTRSTIIAMVRRLRLEPLARATLRAIRRGSEIVRDSRKRIVSGAQWLASLPSRTRLARGYRSLLRKRLSFEELLGSPGPDTLAIVVCLWNRPGRLGDVLRIVDSQRTDRRLRLLLWNNNRDDLGRYRSVVAEFVPTGALESVELFTSPTNVGGMGRFIAARELILRGYAGPFLMMDDDQNFTQGLVEDLLPAFQPGSFSGVWAWNNDGAYWNRTQLETTGALADHVGTGGSVCDSALVTDEAFFTAIPLKFLFMEDIWMSHYVRRNGGRLSMVSSSFDFVHSELDQGHALVKDKEKFFHWLQKPEHIPVRRILP